MDIYTRLMNGESADAIANEFTKALNDAMKKKEATIQQKKESKLKCMEELRAGLLNYLEAFHEDILTDGYDKVTAQDLVDIMDMFADSIGKANNVVKSNPVVAKISKKPMVMTASEATKAINDFLKSCGL